MLLTELFDRAVRVRRATPQEMQRRFDWYDAVKAHVAVIDDREYVFALTNVPEGVADLQFAFGQVIDNMDGDQSVMWTPTGTNNVYAVLATAVAVLERDLRADRPTSVHIAPSTLELAHLYNKMFRILTHRLPVGYTVRQVSADQRKGWVIERDRASGKLTEDMEDGDWRAWIAADGTLHEVTGDITHAEFAHYHYQDHDDSPPDDAEEEEWDVDVSFSRALDEGWIRVGLNLQSYELFITFEETQVTPQALEGLLKTLETRYADYYFADAGDGNPKRMRLRQMTAYLTRMLVRKKVSRGRGNRTPTM